MYFAPCLFCILRFPPFCIFPPIYLHFFLRCILGLICITPPPPTFVNATGRAAAGPAFRVSVASVAVLWMVIDRVPKGPLALPGRLLNIHLLHSKIRRLFLFIVVVVFFIFGNQFIPQSFLIKK